MSADKWPLGREEGRDAVVRETALLTTVQQRLEWLDEMLDLALQTGALARRRAQEDEEIERYWG